MNEGNSKVNLTDKEIKLILSSINPIEFDTYFELWENTTKEEELNIINNLKRFVKDES